MPGVISIKYRKLTQEDFATSDTRTTVNEDVHGVGNVPTTPFVSAANDSAASSAGVQLGEIYFNTTQGRLFSRRT